MNRCSAITKLGARCRNSCTRKYCYLHSRVHSHSKSKLSPECKKKLNSKIAINMEEYHSGRWSSPKQAIAVSYSQMRKKYPKCNF